MSELGVEASSFAGEPILRIDSAIPTDARLVEKDRAYIPEAIETSIHFRAGMASGLPLSWDNDAPTLPAKSLVRHARLCAKRSFDLTAAIFGLFILAPFLLIVSIIIKIESPGPILFRQKRVGMNNELIYMTKFRTMYYDDCDLSGTLQTLTDDRRVTPLGRFLREKSIDELPQLIDVVWGTMSLVGPRPHVPGMLAAGHAYEALVPYYARRHAMKPGMTGWAQANGFRGPTTNSSLAVGRIEHDLAYIQNFSLLLDAKIIAKTLWNEFTRGTGT
jgi:lipopolysaccharide/colanic/teichoic acid biosynthesis glycosyltransferase